MAFTVAIGSATGDATTVWLTGRLREQPGERVYDLPRNATQIKYSVAIMPKRKGPDKPDAENQSMFFEMC